MSRWDCPAAPASLAHSPLLTPGVTLAWKHHWAQGGQLFQPAVGSLLGGLSRPAHHGGPARALCASLWGTAHSSQAEGGLAKFSSERHQDEVDHCPSQRKGGKERGEMTPAARMHGFLATSQTELLNVGCRSTGRGGAGASGGQGESSLQTHQRGGHAILQRGRPRQPAGPGDAPWSPGPPAQLTAMGAEASDVPLRGQGQPAPILVRPPQLMDGGGADARHSGRPPGVSQPLQVWGRGWAERTQPDRTVLHQLTDPSNAYVSSHPPMEGGQDVRAHGGLEKRVCFSTRRRLGAGALAPFHRLGSHTEAPRRLRGRGRRARPAPSFPCPLPPALRPPQQAACLDVGSPENWGANQHPDSDRAPSSVRTYEKAEEGVCPRGGQERSLLGHPRITPCPSRCCPQRKWGSCSPGLPGPGFRQGPAWSSS